MLIHSSNIEYNSSMSARHPKGMKMYAELKRKFCKKCQTDKSTTLFYNDRRRPDGLAYMCKSCKNEEVAKSRIVNPERWKNKRHRNLLAEKFGIKAEDYANLLSEQNHSCAVCRKHKSSFPKRLFVDHCHKTKKIRGLLCQKCNFAIGLTFESKRILRNAIAYLDKFKK